MMYTEDRVHRITNSLKKILNTDNLYEEGKISSDQMIETEDMLDWHINRTITDTKEQLKAFLKARGVSQEILFLIKSFHPRIYYKRKPEEHKELSVD